ncbi:uncharacterized protein TRIVIDRAFT_133796, partial [Trichoderma virens Gv29-8]
SSSQEPSTVKWVIGWRFPVLVLSTFLTGILVDVAHHIYYQSLENTPVQSSNQQVWAIRIGSGLAFLNKTCLVAVMGMVATQQIWFTVRRKFITLRGIDNMFKLMNDPTAIFNRDLLTRAKTLVLLASLSWLVPLIAVVTPATLSVRISLETTTIPTIVPTVSFGNYFNWVLRTTADVGPSADISRLFSATCSSVSYLPLAAPFPNSSYELSYWAPTYKCGNLDEFLAELISPSWERWNWMLDPDPSSFKEAWDEEIKLQPDHAYLAVIPERTPNAFFIWAAGTGSGSGNSSNGTKIVCHLYNTTYELSIRFDNGVQSIIPVNISYLHPQGWTYDYGPDLPGDDDETITSWITRRLFSSLLSGSIIIDGEDESINTDPEGKLNFIADSESQMPLLNSGLISCPEMWNSSIFNQTWFHQPSGFGSCRNQSLAKAIEDLSRNFTYSLMTFQQDNHVFNAIVPVAMTAPHNLYSYDKTTLVATYVAGICVVFFWIGIGYITLWSNGIVSSTSFSAILLTTRNTYFDSLAKGYSVGSDTLPDEIGNVRLKFGRVNNEKLGEHAAFGIDGTVTKLQKG